MEEKQNNKNLSVDRRIRGYSILAKGDKPTIVDEEHFLVPSQSSTKKYEVTNLKGWSCNCPDFQQRGSKLGIDCKHIQAIKFFLKLRNSQEDDILDFCNDLDLQEGNVCPKCQSKSIAWDASKSRQ